MNLVGVVLLAFASVQPAPTPAGAVRPVVWVLSTGGTIAGQGASSTNLIEYRPALLGEQLVANVPEIRDVADVKVEQISNVGSPAITVEIWLRLAKRIDAIFSSDPKVAGVVITHGTNTLEETAYFLNLTVRHDRPVVLVGAMRPASALSADGPLNLLNAVRVAASAEARGKGVLVALNDAIHAARDVTKANTYRVETFRSPDFGPIGTVDGDRVSIYRASTRRHTAQSEFDVSTVTSLPKVEILYSYAEPSPLPIRALVQGGIPGIVFAGTGAGLLAPVERDELAALQSAPTEKRPILVRSNRTGGGRVVSHPDYDRIGMIPADNLNPQKARVLLMLALSKTRDPAAIRRMFEQY
jgi:L-asparaginase type II